MEDMHGWLAKVSSNYFAIHVRYAAEIPKASLELKVNITSAAYENQA